MAYVDNAHLIEAWNTRVAALRARIETLYDGTSHNVLIEDTTVETMLLSSMSLDTAQGAGGMVLTLENPELVSNEQAPQVVIEAPTLILNPEEGSEEETTEESVEDPSDQEEEKEDTVEETVEETVDGIVEEPSDETEEEEVTSEE